MKSIKKVPFDQFYTKEEIVKSLLKVIDFSKYKLAVDPSVGHGAFFNLININKIGIDIDPKIDAIKSDFLKWDYRDIYFEPKDVICITNPPFGRNASHAIKFFNYSTLFADTIAFIMPRSLKKDSMKNRLNLYYHLEYEKDLPENSFIMNNEDYNVPCVFQVYVRKKYMREKYKQIKPLGFKYVKNFEDSDLTIRRVGVYAGHCELKCDKSKESHYFIKLDSFNNIEQLNYIIENVNNIKWTDKTTGPRSIAKTELTPILNEILEKWNK